MRLFHIWFCSNSYVVIVKQCVSADIQMQIYRVIYNNGIINVITKNICISLLGLNSKQNKTKFLFNLGPEKTLIKVKTTTGAENNQVIEMNRQ